MLGDRRRLIMIAGVAALLAVVTWSMWPASPGPSAAAAPPQQAAGAQAAPAPVPPVKLDSLAAGRHGPSDSDRNPFRYKPRVSAPAPVTSAPPTETAEVARPVVPTGPPPPPPIPLKFIGLLERANGVKWAVLSDGKNVMHGREGDIVEGRYRIVKIGTESIELTHLDGRGRQVVRLTGQ